RGLRTAVRVARFGGLPPRTRFLLRGEHARQLLRVLPGHDRGGVGAASRGVARIAYGSGVGRRGVLRRADAFVFAGVRGESSDGGGRTWLDASKAPAFRARHHGRERTGMWGSTAHLADLPGVRRNILDAALGNRTIPVHRYRRTTFRPRRELAHAGRVD